MGQRDWMRGAVLAGGMLAACTGPAAAQATNPVQEATLPGAEIFPEGITATPDGTRYVGSVRQGTIYRIAPGATEGTVFATTDNGDLVSVIGLEADPDAGVLWVCSSDPGRSVHTGKAPPALVALDLETAAPQGRHALPDGGFCNDLARDAQGRIYATDSFNPRILRYDPESDTFEVWLTDDRSAGKGFNLNGVAWHDGALYVVKSNEGLLYRIAVNDDGTPGALTEVATSRPLRRPDGLTELGDGRLVVVEAAGPVSVLDLGTDPVAVEEIADVPDRPTTAVVTDDSVWVVQSQFPHLFAPDRTPGAPGPFRITRLPRPDAVEEGANAVDETDTGE